MCGLFVVGRGRPIGQLTDRTDVSLRRNSKYRPGGGCATRRSTLCPIRFPQSWPSLHVSYFMLSLSLHTATLFCFQIVHQDKDTTLCDWPKGKNKTNTKNVICRTLRVCHAFHLATLPPSPPSPPPRPLQYRPPQVIAGVELSHSARQSVRLARFGFRGTHDCGPQKPGVRLRGRG